MLKLAALLVGFMDLKSLLVDFMDLKCHRQREGTKLKLNFKTFLQRISCIYGGASNFDGFLSMGTV